MPDSFLLDTSAFITLADKEPGFEQVQSLLKAGKRGEAALRKFPVRWHHSDDTLCDEAAKLKAAHKVSFADAFVAATALRHNATLVHKDPEFDTLNRVIKLSPLPLKSGKAA